jgi:SAM-dependent methyltransferase
MSETLTQKIQRDFDRIALLEQPQWNHNNHYYNFLLKQLPFHSHNILEIGCGTGEFSRLLAKRADRLLAIDLSPKMIERAKQNSEGYVNIDYQIADITNWQFPFEEFDAIASIATFHHLPIENLLPQIEKALKPGGKLLILDLIESETTIQDIFEDAIAIPSNLLLQILKNQKIGSTPEAIEAWKEHGRTDVYLTRSQARQIYQTFLPRAIFRKHLFWRYSLVWKKRS